MDILVIWHMDSRFVTQKIHNSEPVSKAKNIKSILSESQLVGYLNSELVPDHIFILVELYWEKKNFHGYNIALKIIKEMVVINKAPNIHFISILYNRNELLKHTNGLQSCFVKSFIHYSIQEDFEININACSVRKWNFLTKFVLTESGQLRQIYHDINNREKVIQEDILSIQNFSDIISENIKTIIDKDLSAINFLELSYLLKQRADELDELKREHSAVKKEYKILIIDDDKHWNRRLRDIFLIHFTNVITFTKGTDTLTYLKNEGSFTDAIFIDLNLLDGPFKQVVWGIDVFDYVLQHYPHIAVRIITGLSSTGIDFLFPKEKPKVLYKRNLSIVDDAYCDDIINDIKQRNILRKLKGPKTAIWSKDKGDLLRYFYKINQNKRKSIWENVYLLSMDLDNNREFISPRFQSTYVKDQLRKGKENEIEEFLITILSHRLFWLNKFYSQGGYTVIDVSKLSSEKEMALYKNRFYFNDNYRTYAGFLGFQITKKKNIHDESEYYLKFDDLFLEESDFLNMILNNSKGIEHTHLADMCCDIHLIFYKEPYYPFTIKEVYDIFLSLTKLQISEPTKEKIKECCRDFIQNATDEFNQLPSELKELIRSPKF